jgi:hypothetical protein
MNFVFSSSNSEKSTSLSILLIIINFLLINGFLYLKNQLSLRKTSLKSFS